MDLLVKGQPPSSWCSSTRHAFAPREIRPITASTRAAADLGVVYEVPAFVHEEIVCRPGLRNIEELQALLWDVR